MAADLMRTSSDPSLPAVLVAAAGIALGFGVILLGWAGANRQPLTAAAVPWVVSGGLCGIAIIGLGVTLAAVTQRRRAIAREVVLLDAATELARRLGRRP